MNKHHQTLGEAPGEASASRPAPQARLHALLFAGATLGTTILALGAASGPKLPPLQGD